MSFRGTACTADAGRPSCHFAEERVDLHLHSTCSDGVKTPGELFAMARRAQVRYLALCDHDTVSGVTDMLKCARQNTGMTVIPGVEVSTGQNGAMHVLGYGPAVLSQEMQRFLRNTGSDRQSRAAAMLDRLAAERIVIPPAMRAELLENPGVGRPHIARALVKVGAVNTVRQAFDRYLAQGRAAYVPRKLPAAAETVERMREWGVVPVLAHPLLLNLEWPALCALVAQLQQCGLMGLEAWHPSASAGNARLLDGLARQKGLLVTGGSDYHGDAGSTVHVGRLPAGWNSRTADAEALMKATQM